MCHQFGYLDLWGKTGEGDVYHPLLFHMLDVAAVSLQLVCRSLGDGLLSQWSGALDVCEADVPPVAAFLCGCHDVGKACPGFQGKSEQQARRLCGLGLKTCPEDERHDAVSLLALREYFRDQLSLDRRIAVHWAATLAGHHGTFPSLVPHASTKPGVGPVEPWPTLRRCLLDELLRVLAPRLAGRTFPPAAWSNAFLMQLAGLCSTADWIGSTEEFFPAASSDATADDYWADSRRRAEHALEALGWLSTAPSGPYQSFGNLFPQCRPMRPLQEAAVAVADLSPELVILEAPMGEGKTEAAFYLAERWRSTRQQRGAYTALPTQATSNQMFQRFGSYLEQIAPHTQVDYHLLHGHAVFSEEYGRIRVGPLYGGPEEGPAAHAWFQARKRGLLAPYGVGTVDQALLAVLKTRHGFVRLFGLAGKTVIFDEIHAYDLYMDELLDRCLEWLRAMGCTVVLLSATLPSRRRKALLSAWLPHADVPDVSYPRITAVSQGRVIAEQFTAAERPSLALEVRTEDNNALWQAVAERVAAGGCAAVICNTVRSAQEAYRALRTVCEGTETEVLLFHARYLLRDRQEIEDRVLRLFGRDGSCRPRSAILVATQVVEQSLDLDFDLMVTELAPVDLVLQRSGRLHRHAERTRPARLQEPTLWLRAPSMDSSGVPAFGASEFIYDYTTLLRTWSVLRGRSQISVETDLETLVEAVYSEEPLADLGGEPGWEDEYARRLAMEQTARAKQWAQAVSVLIPPPSSGDAITVDAEAHLVEDDPAVHRDFRAATRLGEPSVTTVFLHRQPGGELTLDREGAEVVDLDAEPDSRLTRRLVESSCALSGRRLTGELLGGAPPRGWRTSGVLRYARVIALEQGQAAIGKLRVRLDPYLGVLVESEYDG